MEDLHNFAFSQWLKTSYPNKKHVFEGEDKRKKLIILNSQ